MSFIKKDLQLIITKMYFPIMVAMFWTLIMRNSQFGNLSTSGVYTSNPNIVYIDITTNNFSLVNFIFIFIFLGFRIPRKLFKFDNEVRDYLLLSPKSNFQLLWGKIVSASLIMVPFLLISMSVFKCLTFNTFIITFLIGFCFVVVASICSFIKNQFLNVSSTIFILGSIVFFAFVKNPMLEYINTTISTYAFSASFPTIIVLKLLLLSIILMLIVNKIFYLHIRSGKING